MGEAPARAAVFTDLARKARQQGDEYWTLRFLANAFHYLEDCSQPFHTSQIPGKEFLAWPLRPHDPKAGGTHSYAQQVMNIIVYYHVAFEDYVARLMVAARAPEGNREGTMFQADLARGKSPVALKYASRDMRAEVKALAALSARLSPKAAEASVAFFPENPNASYLEFIDESKVLTDDWWVAALRNGQEDSRAKRRYFAVVAAMFEPLGAALRTVVRAEVPQR
jgi:hypothetical protein